jgi:hypothetical protein
MAQLDQYLYLEPFFVAFFVGCFLQVTKGTFVYLSEHTSDVLDDCLDELLLGSIEETAYLGNVALQLFIKNGLFVQFGLLCLREVRFILQVMHGLLRLKLLSTIVRFKLYPFLAILLFNVCYGCGLIIGSLSDV